MYKKINSKNWFIMDNWWWFTTKNWLWLKNKEEEKVPKASKISNKRLPKLQEAPKSITTKVKIEKFVKKKFYLKNLKKDQNLIYLLQLI